MPISNPPRPQRLFRWAALLGLAGLAAATCIFVWSGWSQVVEALAQAGWGIAAIAFFHLCVVAVAGAGWAMLRTGKRPSLAGFVYVMWVRAAINNLMPVARVGGEIAAIPLLTARGLRRTQAIAATVVELTLSVLALFVFVVIGVAMFALQIGGGGTARHLAWALGGAAVVLAAFVLVQRIGIFGWAARLLRILFRDKWAGLAGGGARLDRAVNLLYRRRARILACGLMQFLAWMMGGFEIWLALRFLSHPLGLAQGWMIEALVQGAASAAFAVPGALGVQEAGFLVFGGMLGLPAEIAAALAVMRRCRDLICYAPALFLWQVREGKRLLDL